MKKPLALLLDDEPDILELLEITLNRMAIDTRCAATLDQALRLIKEYKFDICLTDMKLPDGDGLSMVDHIQTLAKPFPVAVITAHGNMDTAVLAMKKGAFDFISKPVDLTQLRQLINNAVKFSDPVESKDRRIRNNLLGDSQVMCAIRAKINKLAQSQAPVFISGESGAGKELVAKLIHQQSPRVDKPFIAINCGAIPYELMESEFFGHKKGSFTGAVTDKKGLFQAAEGGTLFLDEIADLPQPLQVKLLRAIQEKKIRPVGEQQEIPVDVRLLSATHKNLADMVQQGSFRQDLYYRINVIDLVIPPLRERSGDIPQLTLHILARVLHLQAASATMISTAAMNALQHYSFPGNIRELENILERAVALFDGNRIDVDDLNLPLLPQTAEKTKTYDPALGSLEDYLEEIEKNAITDALEENKWNKTAAAKQLGLTFRSFRYRLKKLRLED